MLPMILRPTAPLTVVLYRFKAWKCIKLFAFSMILGPPAPPNTAQTMEMHGSRCTSNDFGPARAAHSTTQTMEMLGILVISNDSGAAHAPHTIAQTIEMHGIPCISVDSGAARAPHSTTYPNHRNAWNSMHFQ